MESKSSYLNQKHKDLGAKMVLFGGWEMPLSYPIGTIKEHLACRNDAVVFDVSHLGTVRLESDTAYEVLQRSFTNDLGKISPGRAQYTHHLDNQGFVVDDIIVWWVDETRFDVMPNASNVSSVIGSIGGIEVTHLRSVLAIQGPNARTLLAKCFPQAASVERFHTKRMDFQGYEVVVAGTGYTGEDGVEIAVPNEIVDELFEAILSVGITPAGLGARDTLRLEAGLVLHGHELGPGITPYQANLGWVVALNKPDFIGKQALLNELKTGPARKLVGIKGESRAPMRSEMEVISNGEFIGTTTSGNYSPVLGHGIAMAFLPPDIEIDTQVTLRGAGREMQGAVCKLPFVKKHG